MSTSRRIGIFGGSFDPPHLSHSFMLYSVHLRCDLDEIWVLPSGDHAFKGGQTPFQHRYEMARLAFQDQANTHVEDIERDLPSPNYTVQTLGHIHDTCDGPVDLSFIIGSDLVDEIPKWEMADSLTDLADLIVVPRQGYPIVDPPDELDDFKTVDMGVDLPELSSTKVRRLLDRDGDIESLVHRDVYRYIRRHGLYHASA